jgi:lysophospholipase L1-like esterase
MICRSSPEALKSLSTASSVPGFPMIIPPNSKLLLIGDSITDCDRARPIGEGLFDALGRGYVNLVNSHLTVGYPAHRIWMVNMGVSGDTVRDLHNRWETDVLALRPNWLSVCIGINDVWRHFHSPCQPEWHVSLDEYFTTLDALLRKTRPTLDGLILMTPYFIEPDRNEPMRELMDRFSEAVRQLAKEYQAILVDTQAAFDDVLRHVHPMALAWDRVHPTPGGHMVLALAFLNAIEFQWKQNGSQS